MSLNIAVGARVTPGDPHYILDEPGYYLAYPTILITGRRPVESL